MLTKLNRRLLVSCSLTAALLVSTAPAALAAGHPVENNAGGAGAGQVNGAAGRDSSANGEAHSANAGASETGRTSSAAGQATAADNKASAAENKADAADNATEHKAHAAENKADKADTPDNARTAGGNRGSGRSGGTERRSTTRSGPPGNNGTIKIDGVEFDSHPNNEPHVDCMFEIDFYGFDANQAVTVDFALQAPTTGGTITGTSPSGTTLDGDDNSFGGSERGLDGSLRYTLGFSGVTPHPKQGYHVKVTVHAPGANGADTKHKVFWVAPCGGTADTALVTPLAATATPGDSEVVQNPAPVKDPETGRVTVLGVVFERSSAAGVDGSLLAAGSPVAGVNAGNVARVLGVTLERGGALARTGFDVFQLMTIAALALLAGAAAVRVSRRKASESALIAN